MYEINYNDTTLYYPGDKECCVSEAVLNTKVGDSGEFNSLIPPNNPLYNTLTERQIITIYQDGEEFWRGDIREISTNFRGMRSIYCLEDLAFLGEVVKYAHSETKTYEQYFVDLLTEYNARVNPEKRFNIGYILKNPNTVHTFEYETMSILELLRAAADDYYVRVRRMGGKRYIDIVDLKTYNAGTVNNQHIRFGDNMMDFVKESNTSWLLTAIMPVGAELETETIENIPDRVTIESVNGGSKILVNSTAEGKYGYIEKYVEFENIESPSELKDLAETYLKENSQPRLTMQIQAVDLSTIENVDSYRLGDIIHITCEPFDIDQDVSLCELEIDLLDPSRNSLTLSSAVERRSFTEIQNKISEEVKKIPAKSEVLSAAKKNASSLINGNGTNGHVVLHENDDGVIYEILIMDTPDINTATKLWRWNQKGLGYADHKDASGEWDFGLAMTMEGKIVADYITTGSLIGLEIDNGNGTFHVTPDGLITALNATIAGTIKGSVIEGDSSFDMSVPSGARLLFGTKASWPKNLVIQNAGSGGGFDVLKDSSVGKESMDVHYNDIRRYDSDGGREYAQFGSSNSSDARLKENIKDADKKAIKKLFESIEFKTFNYIEDEDKESYFGVIAQQLIKVLEDSGIDKRHFIGTTDGFYTVSYSELARLNLIATQDLYEIVKRQQEEINALKRKEK